MLFEVWSTLQETMVPLARYSVTRQGLALQSPVFTSSPTTFNIYKLHVLPTECIYAFCMDIKTNSDYFPIQH